MILELLLHTLQQKASIYFIVLFTYSKPYTQTKTELAKAEFNNTLTSLP